MRCMGADEELYGLILCSFFKKNLLIATGFMRNTLLLYLGSIVVIII